MPDFFARIFQKKQPGSIDLQPVLAIGSLVGGRYRLDSEIGQGGMGMIFRAHDQIEDHEVALKVINPKTANALSLGQFARESEILSKLSHPHIVTMFEAGFVNDDPSLPFLAMEFLPGKPLSEMGALTYSRMISMARQICDALGYIHKQGFVYRDIKPENILLNKSGFEYSVKLVDFGLARPIGEAYLPNESNLAGTVFYLAPELIDGQVADIRSDLYALGILLYEMIVGRVPFSDVDESTVQLQHRQQPPPLPSQSRPGVPPELDTLVLRLLEKNPQDRPSSVQEVLEALDAVHFDKPAQGNLPTNIPDRAGVQLVIQLLADHSLVTLAGNDPSLALSAASHLAAQFPDGIWVVELEQISEPAGVFPAVFFTFSLNANPNRPPLITLIEFLREKNLLLLLTHCGHVSGACAQLAGAVLQACPDVRILAVSAKAFNLPMEKYADL